MAESGDSAISAQEPGSAIVLEDVTLADGCRATVTVADGSITAVDRCTHGDSQRGPNTLQQDSSASTLSLAGYILLPALVEPHAHLDKALLGERVTNDTYDLPGAIAAMDRAYPSMTVDDTYSRAARAAANAVSRGCLTIRSHADCNSRVGTRAIEALIRLRDSLRSVVEIQIAALAGWPITGPEGASNRAALAHAVELGIDLVGGAPWLDDNPSGAITELVAVARGSGLGVDLHLDGTTDASISNLRHLSQTVRDAGLAGPVTASHCVSLGVQDERVARESARILADAGIGVVTLPQTNLYLQGRDYRTRAPRGLAPVRLLQEEGVRVAAGGDNTRDPFNPMGSGDPLEAAMLLVCAGHASPAEAYAAVSADARAVLGCAPRGVEVGSRADLVAIRATDLTAAIATRTHDRIVFSNGALISSTAEHTQLAKSLLHALP